MALIILTFFGLIFFNFKKIVYIFWYILLFYFGNHKIKKYIFSGSLVGRYYDENGSETSYMIEFKKRVKQCKLEKENAKKQDQLYPPCNIAWSEEDGTRVWCTKTR